MQKDSKVNRFLLYMTFLGHWTFEKRVSSDFKCLILVGRRSVLILTGHWTRACETYKGELLLYIYGTKKRKRL